MSVVSGQLRSYYGSMSIFKLSNKRGFVLAVIAGFWGVLLWVMPFYAGFSGPGKWVCYLVGVVLLTASLWEAFWELDKLLGQSDAYKELRNGGLLIFPALVIHLITEYVPISGHPPMLNFLGPTYALLRIVVLVLLLFGAVPTFSGLARLPDEMRESSENTEATVTVLAFAGALLPLLGAIISALWR